MSEKNLHIFNKKLRDKYYFISLKVNSNKNIKRIIEREFKNILNKRNQKVFKIVEFLDNEILIYIITNFKTHLNWEEFILDICKKRNIHVENFGNFNLNPV